MNLLKACFNYAPLEARSDCCNYIPSCSTVDSELYTQVRCIVFALF